MEFFRGKRERSVLDRGGGVQILNGIAQTSSKPQAPSPKIYFGAGAGSRRWGGGSYGMGEI